MSARKRQKINEKEAGDGPFKKVSNLWPLDADAMTSLNGCSRVVVVQCKIVKDAEEIQPQVSQIIRLPSRNTTTAGKTTTAGTTTTPTLYLKCFRYKYKAPDFCHQCKQTGDKLSLQKSPNVKRYFGNF